MLYPKYSTAATFYDDCSVTGAAKQSGTSVACYHFPPFHLRSEGLSSVGRLVHSLERVAAGRVYTVAPAAEKLAALVAGVARRSSLPAYRRETDSADAQTRRLWANRAQRETPQRRSSTGADTAPAQIQHQRRHNTSADTAPAQDDQQHAEVSGQRTRGRDG